LIGLIEVNNNLPIKDTRYSDNLDCQIPVTQLKGLSDTRYSAIGTYQIPVTQLKGQRENGDMGNGDMQAAKAILKCATYRRYTDLSVMGVRVGVFKRYGR